MHPHALAAASARASRRRVRGALRRGCRSTPRRRRRPARSRIELLPKVVEVRRGIEVAARYALQQLTRWIRRPVPVDVLAQPLADRLELAARELFFELAELLLRPPPD